MKKTNKLLSIILAILMIATSVPFAFAADETPDFSDAKVLTVNSDGILCIDGVPVDYKAIGSLKRQYIPDGKYKLSGDISMRNSIHFFTVADSDVIIDLNGYTWNSRDFVLYVQGSFSVYDTSAQKTGRIISDTSGMICSYIGASEINLYSGTLENIHINAARNNCVINLYGGKIKCDSYAIFCDMQYSYTVNLYDTVLEISEGVAHIETYLYSGETAQAVINVADYTGDDLTIGADINSAGKIKILQGVKNAEEAEKYTVVLSSEAPSYYLERTEYNEETGELFAYVVANAFTQQPSAENDYTVDFNNPDATFQWYEAEKTVLTPENTTAFDGVTFENGKWLNTANDLFTVSVQAGDIIRASTSSDSSFNLDVYTEDYSFLETITFERTVNVTINNDAEVIVSIQSLGGWEKIAELEFELIRTSEINETETEKKLQHPECEKTYCCKATVGESDYLSDVVTVVHDIVVDDEAVAPDCVNTGLTEASHCTRCDDMTVEQEVIPALNHKDTLVQVEAKANTCTEIGWDAYEYCTACTYTTYVEIPALDHDIVIDDAVAPTCTETGLTEGSHCSRCEDATVAQEVVPDLGGHADENGDGKCDNGGEQLTCEDCGRPVHGESFIENLICMIIMFINLIISMFA